MPLKNIVIVTIVLGVMIGVLYMSEQRSNKAMSVDYCFKDSGEHYICNDTGEHD